jgi:hypothetical protein
VARPYGGEHRVSPAERTVYYLFDANDVRVLTVMTVPPVPIDE